MTVESVMAFATPVSVIVAIVMQQRAATKAATERDAVKTTLVDSEKKATKERGEIHTLVNDQMTKALKKIDELQKKLVTARRRRPRSK